MDDQHYRRRTIMQDSGLFALRHLSGPIGIPSADGVTEVARLSTSEFNTPGLTEFGRLAGCLKEFASETDLQTVALDICARVWRDNDPLHSELYESMLMTGRFRLLLCQPRMRIFCWAANHTPSLIEDLRQAGVGQIWNIYGPT